MGAESTSDTNRKTNCVDYTTADDCGKISVTDQHLTAENKEKRDKSPSGLAHIHNDVSAAEQMDNFKQIADKSNECNSGKHKKTICYDFKKGICRRRFCRYPHVMNADQVVFCHDFQNNGCFRNNCRFIHRSIEDEEHYRFYGVFPMLPERQIPNVPDHIHNAPPPQMNNPNICGRPINTNMNMHYEQQQQQPLPQPQQQQSLAPPPTQFHQSNAAMPLPPHSRRRSFNMCDNSVEQQQMMQPKRPHLDDNRQQQIVTSAYNTQNNENSLQCRNAFVETNGIPTTVANQVQQIAQSAAPAPQPIQAPSVTSVVIGEDVINIYRLYEEHNLLRRRVEINEERLQELRATNTYLLHQNEQLRRQTQCSCTNTIVNPVTLTTAQSQTTAAQQQVLNTVSIAPVQMQATPIVSIANIAQPQTQIIASTAPGIALAATTTQGQQLALASTPQAGQILATQTGQILATAPSMGIMNTSQSLAMSANATQPIISYPVMTHSILPH